MKKETVATILLGLSMFFTGASGLVVEYVMSTVSTYILGSSIVQFSITIAIMLGMMGVGSHVQKYVNDNGLVSKFVYIELSLAVIGSFSPILIYAASGYMEEHFNLIYYTTVSAIGFLIGFEIPFIVRINEKYATTLKANLSMVMSMDYVGSFAGAIVWVYILLPHFNLNQISFIVSGVNLFIAFITVVYFIWAGIIKFSKLKAIVFTSIAGLMIYGYSTVLNWEGLLEQKMYEDPIVSTTTTKYQHLTVTKNNSLNELRLYINGNVQFSSLDERRYHEMLVHIIMTTGKSHENVLVLGGGDGLALRELKKYKSIKNITLVDLDPGMVQFAKTNPYISRLNEGVFNDARVHVLESGLSSNDIKDVFKKDNKGQIVSMGSVNVVNVDADLLLSKIKDNKFDIIIIDFPDPSSIELSKLYTKQFYLKLKRVMHKDTRIIVQSTSPYHAKEAFLCIGRTINSAGIGAIPVHANIPSFGDWGWWIGGLTTPTVVKNEVAGIKEMLVETSFVTPDFIQSSLVFGKGELNSKNNEINNLMKPVLLDIYTNNSWLTY